MNPEYIPKLIEPIINKTAEFTKGNRFRNIDVLINMPKIRLIGNIILSFITKLSTGYWELFDPTNGFIAINSGILNQINYKNFPISYSHFHTSSSLITMMRNSFYHRLLHQI